MLKNLLNLPLLALRTQDWHWNHQFCALSSYAATAQKFWARLQSNLSVKSWSPNLLQLFTTPTATEISSKASHTLLTKFANRICKGVQFWLLLLPNPCLCPLMRQSLKYKIRRQVKIWRKAKCQRSIVNWSKLFKTYWIFLQISSKASVNSHRASQPRSILLPTYSLSSGHSLTDWWLNL